MTTFKYNFESRLTQVSGAPGTHNYTYNGLDTRVSKNIAGQTTSFLRDGAYVTDPVIEDSHATYTPGVSERRGGTTCYTHSGLKNTGAQSTNAIVATRVYDAYAAVRNTAGTTGTWSGPIGYGGDYGFQEDETGLRLLGHRYYDASTGRFLTRGPIKDGRNWYSYADGDPTNAVDPTGLYRVILGRKPVSSFPDKYHYFLIIEEDNGDWIKYEAFPTSPVAGQLIAGKKHLRGSGRYKKAAGEELLELYNKPGSGGYARLLADQFDRDFDRLGIWYGYTRNNSSTYLSLLLELLTGRIITWPGKPGMSSPGWLDGDVKLGDKATPSNPRIS